MEGFITGQFIEVQCRHIKEYRLTPCCVLLCTNAYLFIYQSTVRCFFRALSEMRKERNGDEYKEIRRASCSIEKPQNG